MILPQQLPFSVLDGTFPSSLTPEEIQLTAKGL